MNAEAALAVEAEPEDELGTPEDPVLNGRYQVVRNAPLAGLCTPVARAFKAVDLEGGAIEVFALVSEMAMAPRSDEIAELRNLTNTHLMRLIDAGTVPFVAPGEANHTIIAEYPRGGRIMPAENPRPMSEADVRKRVIGPLCDALAALHERGVMHRSVHPHNLFYADELGHRTILGECVSAVAGQTQPAAFEPLERASAAPLGRGVGGPEADVFAFGVTILALLMGGIPGAGVAAPDLLEARMEKGSKTALFGEYRCSRGMERLIAGLLADSPGERWSLVEVGQWLAGEPVTGVIIPRSENPIRPFPFAKRQFHGTRALAEAFNRHWNEAAAEIQTERLEKWLASHREWMVMSESVTSLREGWAGGGGKMSTDELISRTCILLDRDGPIRYKGISVTIGGLGPLLAGAYIEGRDELAQKIGTVIALGLPLAWIGADNERRKALASATAKFTRLKQYISKPDIGYGLERCLYELSPTLRCLAPVLEPVVRVDPRAMLTGLDSAATDIGETTPWSDRHVAAFLAAALHPRSDATLASTKLPDDPKLAHLLSGLVLFAMAQGRLGLPHLPHLSRAMGPSVASIVGVYRGQSIRAELLATLDRLLGEGDLAAIVKQLTDPEVLARDYYGYNRAVSDYARSSAEIAVLETNVARRRSRAILIGRRIAAWIAYLGLAVTVLNLLSGLRI